MEFTLELLEMIAANQVNANSIEQLSFLEKLNKRITEIRLQLRGERGWEDVHESIETARYCYHREQITIERYCSRCERIDRNNICNLCVPEEDIEHSELLELLMERAAFVRLQPYNHFGNYFRKKMCKVCQHNKKQLETSAAA